MTQAQFRFYEELNDFLPKQRQKAAFLVKFPQGQTVKSLIEGLGVPHTEVDLILANSQSVDFSYQIKEGDYISVYPMFESLDISSVTRIRPQGLRIPKFVLDTHLGRLARHLRMLGFDTSYKNHCEDTELAEISCREHRALLTRDQELLKRNKVTRGYWVRSTKPTQQLIEILRRFHLQNLVQALSRCIRCNAILQRISAESMSDRLPQDVLKTQRQVKICPSCRQLYWQGSHTQRMELFRKKIMKVCE